LLVVVAVALVLSGCPKKTPPEGTGTVAPPAPPTPVAAAITYQCPMCKGEASENPGQCSTEGCDAFLVAQAPEGQEVEYYCDMHDEPFVQSEPGRCPECNMFLPARFVEDVDDDDADDDADDDGDENGDENGDEDSDDADDEE
jgi:hypothetical protein